MNICHWSRYSNSFISCVSIWSIVVEIQYIILENCWSRKIHLFLLMFLYGTCFSYYWQCQDISTNCFLRFWEIWYATPLLVISFSFFLIRGVKRKVYVIGLKIGLTHDKSVYTQWEIFECYFFDNHINISGNTIKLKLRNIELSCFL